MKFKLEADIDFLREEDAREEEYFKKHHKFPPKPKNEVSSALRLQNVLFVFVFVINLHEGAELYNILFSVDGRFENTLRPKKF